jgi:hypothetical protein
MAFAEVSGQSGSAHNNGAPGVMTFGYPNPVTLNDLLVGGAVWWRSGGASATAPVSDDRSTPYDQIISDAITLGSGTYRLSLWGGVAPSSGTCNGQFAPSTDSFMAEGIDAFTGQHASPPSVSSTTPNTGTSTTPSATISTATDGELIIGIMSHGNGANPSFSLDAPSTEFGHEETANVDMPISIGFRIAGAAGSYTMNWTIASSSAWATLIRSFKAADGAGVTPDSVFPMSRRYPLHYRRDVFRSRAI